MDPETARIVAICIAAVGAVIWLTSLQFLLSTLRQDRERQRKAAEVLELTEPAPPNCIVGSTEVEGQPAELIVKAAALLAKGNPPIAPFKILERTDNRIVFEDVGLGMQHQVHVLKQGQLRFAPAAPGRTRIDFAIELRKGGILLMMAFIIQTLGLVVLVGGFALINIWIVDNANPEVRAQAVQMVQAIHFLWPPFLFAGLYRAGRRMAVTSIELLINNLPYHAKD